MLTTAGRMAGVVALAGVLAIWPVVVAAEGPRVPFFEDAGGAATVPPASGGVRPAVESNEQFLRGRVWAGGVHPDWSFVDAAAASGPPSSNGEDSRKPAGADLHLHPDHWVAVSPSAPAPPDVTATTGPAGTAMSGS
jgi:hypothetical protein